MKHVVIALAAAIAMLLLQPPASALSATSTFIPCNDGRNCFIISIDGELRPDDERDFARKIAMSEPGVAVVVLNSPGGNLIAGIAIGQIIRSKGYSTVVSEDHKCASACALIWLAGKRRIAERGALIGFHAAYVTNRNGFAAETGMGNALVGAYLKEIGLSYKAIAYLTQASPYQMTWLTAGDAKALGIDAETVDKSRRATQARGLGVKIIPGTKWMISATKLEEDATTCQLTAETNHAEFRVTIGSKGSLVILLRDQYQENAIRDTLGWGENQSYQAVLFIDKREPIYIQAHRIWEHTLLIPLSSIDPNIIFTAKRIAIAVGGISMRSYDVDGLSVARASLYECRDKYIAVRKASRPTR